MSEVCAMFSPECHGRLEWHHAIKQQRLRRMFRYDAWRGFAGDVWEPLRRGELAPPGCMKIDLGDILGDERNRVWLCSHHHELVTNGRLEVTLPESVWEFAAEFGFTAQLENDLARRSAA